MTSARDKIIEATARLLETQGYFATGLNQIIAESGAPKGSLYYYFPDGKEGLTVEVIQRLAQINEERIRGHLALFNDATEAIVGFLHTLAGYVEASNCRGGGPITTVALETATSSERLRGACQNTYAAWRVAFEEKLLASGYPSDRAQRLSTLIIAAIEGAIILCRTTASADPLHQIADEMRLLLKMSTPR